MKRIISILCIVCFFVPNLSVYAENTNQINAKSMILMEASTGKVLNENNADERLPIASITKIMTLLLIMEAIDAGKITLDDKVTVSEYAMSMGGSTMFLETGEELSVHEMIKGIAVASANDGCVAMAEHLMGSEDAFVELMNTRAKELGMENTNFMNTNGLDEEGHYSSARDVAIMSRELIKYKKIFEYTTIWTGMMNNDQYELSNTNKLIRFYQGANGLKTGSTDAAGCCLSATAKRDNMQLIAVVLGASNSNDRFNGARALLDYGFANYAVEMPYKDGEIVESIKVKKGIDENVGVVLSEGSFLIEKSQKSSVEKIIEIPEEVTAPITKGEKIGVLKFIINGEVIAEKDLIASASVEKKNFINYFIDILKIFVGK